VTLDITQDLVLIPETEKPISLKTPQIIICLNPEVNLEKIFYKNINLIIIQIKVFKATYQPLKKIIILKPTEPNKKL
jgi:hypothetical protein